jgi:hypothetical protein
MLFRWFRRRSRGTVPEAGPGTLPAHLLGYLLAARSKYVLSSPRREEEFYQAMTLLFGQPHKCIVCGEKATAFSVGKEPMDLDSWFCSMCCPVCG